MTKRAKKEIGIAVTAVAAVAGLAVVGVAIFNQHFKYVKPTWDYTWEDNGDIEQIQAHMPEELYDPQADPSQCLTDLNEDGSFKSID